LTEYAEQGPINGWFNWPGKIVRKVSVRKSFSKVEKMRSLVIKMEEVREKKKDRFFFFFLAEEEATWQDRTLLDKKM